MLGLIEIKQLDQVYTKLEFRTGHPPLKHMGLYPVKSGLESGVLE